MTYQNNFTLTNGLHCRQTPNFLGLISLPLSSAPFPPTLGSIPKSGILFKSPHFTLALQELMCY